jgi:photosystem II stability/assembly factor-like uncharacterized protein
MAMEQRVRLVPHWRTSVVLGVILASSPSPMCSGQSDGAKPPAWRVMAVEDISPDQSSLQDTDPDGASGGRVNGLALVEGDHVAYAASEWGGIFKSLDGGRTWSHLDSHLPAATWRVKVDPTNGERVYATSFYDGRVTTFSGINVSEDGGRGWVHAASAVPPAGFCKNPAFQTEFSAFGISISPDDPKVVYVGTACGIAISADRGKTWNFVDPNPADAADVVWDVVAHPGGIVDACGNDGHSRSRNSGKTWTPTNSLPSGRCSLAGSPDEADVLFAVSGTQPYESDDGGAHWTTLENPAPQGRIPFVKTNKRSGSSFDLWFGDITLYRIPCKTPSPGSPGSGPRCPAGKQQWHGPFTRTAGGHDDVGDLVFSTAGAADRCPRLFASDGGVYLATLPNSPACQDPTWRQPDITPHGLWLLSLDGAPQSGAGDEDLYIGNQDDGTFGTRGARAVRPVWNNSDCCDSPLLSASKARILYASCCYGKPDRFNQLFIAEPGLVNGKQITDYPPGDIPGWEPRILSQFAPNKYAVITTAGIFTTPDIRSKPIKWNPLGGSSTPSSACAVLPSTPSKGPAVFYVQAGDCDGRVGSSIYVLMGATWKPLNQPNAKGTFGVFTVDAHSPLRLLGSFLSDDEPRVAMVLSEDGGKTWMGIPSLDICMVQNGTFQYQNQVGPTDTTTFVGYPQPTAVAFDPQDDNVLAAAGTDSGLFLSVDKGSHWQPVLMNNRPLYRVRAIRFSHADPNTLIVFAGSEGAGVWRIRLTR